MTQYPDGHDQKGPMEAILTDGSLGHLAMRDGPGVYVIPINYTYIDGKILLHCALEGKKLDLIRTDPSVCFEVGRQEGTPIPHAGDACDNAFESVICWGAARFIEDIDERCAILEAFQARYETPTRKWDPISPEQAARCGAIEITVTRMTGRRKTGTQKAAWQWEAQPPT